MGILGQRDSVPQIVVLTGGELVDMRRVNDASRSGGDEPVSRERAGVVEGRNHPEPEANLTDNPKGDFISINPIIQLARLLQRNTGEFR